MTGLEISKALALAIGWTNLLVVRGTLLVYVGGMSRTEVGNVWRHGYRVFDYRDWNVIGPIAERYNCFPSRNGLSQTWWPPQVVRNQLIKRIMEDTPQKAIAMAVIERAKQ